MTFLLVGFVVAVILFVWFRGGFMVGVVVWLSCFVVFVGFVVAAFLVYWFCCCDVLGLFPTS